MEKTEERKMVRHVSVDPASTTSSIKNNDQQVVSEDNLFIHMCLFTHRHAHTHT